MLCERHNLFGSIGGIVFDFNDRPLGCTGECRMTPLERKIIRRAAEIAGDRSVSCIWAISIAMTEIEFPKNGNLYYEFRHFYSQWGCPLDRWPKNERLRTIRVLLLETFLIFDGRLE